MKTRIIAAIAASTLVFAACGSDDSSSDTTAAAVVDTTMPAATGNIVEVASANEDFSTLVAAVTAAGLGETL